MSEVGWIWWEEMERKTFFVAEDSEGATADSVAKEWINPSDSLDEVTNLVK